MSPKTYDPEDLALLATQQWELHDADSNYAVSMFSGQGSPVALFTDRRFKGAADMRELLGRLGFVNDKDSPTITGNSFNGYDGKGFMIIGEQNTRHLTELLKAQGIDLKPVPNEITAEQARKLREDFSSSMMNAVTEASRPSLARRIMAKVTSFRVEHRR